MANQRRRLENSHSGLLLHAEAGLEANAERTWTQIKQMCREHMPAQALRSPCAQLLPPAAGAGAGPGEGRPTDSEGLGPGRPGADILERQAIRQCLSGTIKQPFSEQRKLRVRGQKPAIWPQALSVPGWGPG